ncbi:Acyl-coenzyme A synthetase/AMP-(fatty) acid ligase [Collimonas sp. OK607]|uniref:AMP-binding protein n=1 Tax=Collimonas sp. OK607 TaxID=1798194 RepID=UPI0008E1B110|nr:AMP-binding protein [Collimonas sp. OK607]SFA70519.1 Acyl-coenzyme A synthetase/AMP-(fatty) acid ligase [Collimonas sp. OK607]
MFNPPDLLTLLSAPSGRNPGQVQGQKQGQERERPFAWRDGKPLSHAWLVTQVAAWRRLLSRQAGSRFALYSSDSATFACILLGAWQADKTIYLPGDVLPATCANLSALVDGYLGEFPPQYAPLALDIDDANANDGHNHSHAEPEFKALLPDFPGLVIYTSGSTGEPQAVPKFLSQLATEVASLEQLFGSRIGNADVVSTVSHQHIYGLLFKILWPLTNGRVIHAQQIAYLEELQPQPEGKPVILISSPAHLRRLPGTFTRDQVASIRAIFSSGGPLVAEVAVAAGALLGSIPVEVYGSSETGGVAWRQRVVGADDSWQVMPAITWRVGVNDDVLEICSPHLPDSDWYALADQVQLIDPQRFRLKGRVDRIVKVEEKRISLDGLERQLKAMKQVADARVLLIGQPELQHTSQHESRQRQRIAAFVVPSAAGLQVLATQGKLALNRMLRNGMAHAVEAVALPRSWRYLDAMPVNAQGKTTRADLLALLESPAPASSNPAELPRKPLVRMLEQETDRVLLELTVPADLLYFDGHFDGASILPGVVQLDWAISYGRQYFPLAPHFRGMLGLKFQRVILPGAVVQLELLHDTQKSSLAFRMMSAAGPHASGRITFGAGHAAS